MKIPLSPLPISLIHYRDYSCMHVLKCLQTSCIRITAQVIPKHTKGCYKQLDYIKIQIALTWLQAKVSLA